MRKPFVAGNWKMNLLVDTGRDLAVRLKESLEGINHVETAVCPPFVIVPAVCEVLRGSPIKVGAQNMYYEESGAFTGEVSGSMLMNAGCTYVILGHSERRHIFGEDDDLINKKVKAALAVGLKPIFCVGEKLEEREAGKTKNVVETQVKAGLAGVTAEEMEKVTVAYEPVWAIGTGKTATPEQAQEVHEFIRGLLAAEYGDETASAVRLQYGGSVKPGNAKALMTQPDIDGALVGGASLEAESFTEIVRAAVPDA